MLINIFKIVMKDENEAGKTWMVSIYPQGGYIDKRSSFLSTKRQQFRARKIFSILCFAQQLVTEPEVVLNSYQYSINNWNIKSGEKENEAGKLICLFDYQCHLDKVFYDENSISYAVMHWKYSSVKKCRIY